MNLHCGHALAYNTTQQTVQTPIKVNLALHVIGLLENNYHNIESLVVFAPCGDIISIKTSINDNFNITGRFATQLNNKHDNLILKTRDKLRNFAAITNAYCAPVDIKLQKDLPVASGLGGGSGDAAATLLLLNNIWGLNLTRDQLFTITAELGADVPACLHYLLHKKSLYMCGLGEKLTVIERMPSFYMLLLNDLTPISTKLIFEKLENKSNNNLAKPCEFANLADLLSYLTQTRNDLYESAASFNQNIKKMYKAVEKAGALFTTMSGSGATIVGIFETHSQAKLASITINKNHPNWFYKIICCFA